MTLARSHIQVFEFGKIKVGETYGETKFTEALFLAFQMQCANKLSPYFSLLRNGVQFNQFVGVIQVGQTLYEVLPKADRAMPAGDDEVDKKKWQSILIGMMRAVHGFDVRNTGDAQLKVRNNTILDLYFELFIHETERLLHQGLIKKYRKKEGNTLALKGQLLFAQHLRSNLVHQERFYVKHTVYDQQHQLHMILFKVLLLLKRINTNSVLQSRIGSLLLNFPEMPDIQVTSQTFDRLVYNRKSETYKKAINIAKMILLNFHPDVSKGRQDSITLMFDMNKLWEAFVGITLRKDNKYDWEVKLQGKTKFWESTELGDVNIKPDIVVTHNGKTLALDTKWKYLDNSKPSADDLRQMYVYTVYFNAQSAGLIYPGPDYKCVSGKYSPSVNHEIMPGGCFIQFIKPQSNVSDWQSDIRRTVYKRFNALEIIKSLKSETKFA